ncbi:MAG: hypothetical protein AAF197_12345, partial [Pseudomonadota bacterium]
MIFYLSAIASVLFILAFLWMRWQMKISKGRFALTVVATLLVCLSTGLSAVSTTLSSIIISNISEFLGFGRIESGASSLLVLTVTTITMLLIYHFGVSAIKHWEAPTRVSEINLAESYQHNNILALSIENLRLLLRGQKDHLASETAVNWRAKMSHPPSPIPVRELLKDLLVTAISEIRISDDGWRDDGNYWIGEILGPTRKDTRSIIVLICDKIPDADGLRVRIEDLIENHPSARDSKLYALYKSNSLQVRDDTTASTLRKDISIFSSRELLRMSLDLNYYAHEIIDQFTNTRVGGTSATLQSSYVDLKIKEDIDNTDPVSISAQLSKWVSQESSEHVVLTGEYGQGKSTVLLKFCYDWAVRFTTTGYNGERIPLLIELRGQSPSEIDPLGFLSTWCSRYRLPPQLVLNLIKSGDALIIFEGFDEIRNAGRAYFRHEHFNALWRFAYPGTKIIFSGRPNFFLDQEEANRTLRNQEARKLAGDVFTVVWRLQKLSRLQIAEACRCYTSDIQSGIISATQGNREFLDIISRPSMIPVVATI